MTDADKTTTSTQLGTTGSKNSSTMKKTEPPEVPKMSNEDLARDIVHAISHELHIRTGIGPIWRQLNEARKKEIIEKWNYETSQLLAKHR
jgi:hypothetical protein